MVRVTKAKSQRPTGKTTRRPPQPQSMDAGIDEGGDVCEQVLAELQARRVRLRKLLHLLRTEVERVQATSAPARSRTKCGS
jgi:hypothetical protein